MKHAYIKLILILLTGFSLCSCERGELLNSEADILAFILPPGMMTGEPIISNNKVRIPKTAVTPKDSAELEEQLKSLVPEFILTEGAIISDEGKARDFTTTQTYTVTSEDRKLSKDYLISFFESKLDRTSFSFSNYELSDGEKKYFTFFEIDDRTGEQLLVWDSGNSGFALTAKKNLPPGEYPASSTLAGKIGAGVKLATCSTGAFGSLVGMPIAAGNLFLGSFDLRNATSKPLEATEFGAPTAMEEPKKMTLWCKYKAGPEYKDKQGNILPGITDRPEIYAVIYEPDLDKNGRPVRLNGTNVRTSENIITIAAMDEETAGRIRVNDIEKDEYIFVEIPFVRKKEFQVEKQNKGIYHIALVFSSSAKGNLFEGAVGSTLYVDEIEFTN